MNTTAIVCPKCHCNPCRCYAAGLLNGTFFYQTPTFVACQKCRTWFDVTQGWNCPTCNEPYMRVHTYIGDHTEQTHRCPKCGHEFVDEKKETT